MMAPDSLPPGVARKYRLERLLGTGGMSRVYLARQLDLDREVALKIFRRVEGLALSRFHREARLLAAMKHPGILEVFDAGIEDETIYLACEVVPGGTLRGRGRGLDADEILKVLCELAAALDHAHAQGIIHRDLKPENVFLAADGSVKLADFGLARPVESGDTVTAAGKICGTPAYMSPEQIQGARLDAASDVYSFALLAYELLAGELPHAGETPMAIAVARMKEPPRPIHALLPAAPAALGTVFARAFDRQPSVRHATCGELARDLSQALGGGDLDRTREVMRDTLALSRAETTEPSLELPTRRLVSGEDAHPCPSAENVTLQSGKIDPGQLASPRPAARRLPIAAAAVIASVILVTFVLKVRSGGSVSPPPVPASLVTAAPLAPEVAPARREIDDLASAAAALGEELTKLYAAYEYRFDLGPGDIRRLETFLDGMGTALRRIAQVARTARPDSTTPTDWVDLDEVVQILSNHARSAKRLTIHGRSLESKLRSVRQFFDGLSRAASENSTNPYAAAMTHSFRMHALLAGEQPLSLDDRIPPSEEGLQARSAIARLPVPRSEASSALLHQALLLRRVGRLWEKRETVAASHDEIPVVRLFEHDALQLANELERKLEAQGRDSSLDRAVGLHATAMARLAEWNLESARPDRTFVSRALALVDRHRRVVVLPPGDELVESERKLREWARKAGVTDNPLSPAAGSSGAAPAPE